MSTLTVDSYCVYNNDSFLRVNDTNKPVDAETPAGHHNRAFARSRLGNSILASALDDGKVSLDDRSNMQAQEKDEQRQGPKEPAAVEMQRLRCLLY